MALNLEPRRIVKGSAGDSTQPFQKLNDQRYGRTAIRAELKSKRAAALIGPMLIRVEGPARNLDVFRSEVGYETKSASGATLAERAVTNSRSRRRTSDTIAYSTAKTSTFMGFRHSPFLLPVPYGCYRSC